LISWQCKKQTVVATSSTEAKCVAAASCYAQVLWIQNQLLDYGLVDKKRVIITEATIKDALRLDDVEGIECLPNEEIFTELSRMGYEKPSTKLTFYKAFFSSQWKFLIYIILLVRNVDSSTKFYMYLCFLQLMIRKQVVDLPSHITKYSSPALIQKVFANMRRVGKGCSGVETSLFEGMIVEQQVDEGADEVHVDDVPAVGVDNEGAASVADDAIHIAVEEPSIPSPTPSTPPPQPSQDIPSTSQVHLIPPQSPQAQPQSPQHQPQPSHDDKITQALEITKLKQRVKKLERKNKASGLRRLKKGRMIADMDADVDVTLKDVALDAKIDESANVQGRQAESQAQIYQIDLEHANKVLSMQDDKVKPVELQKVVEVVITAKLITEGVVIRDPEETTTPSTINHSEAKSKDKGKGILVEESKPLKKQAQIEQDEAYARELEVKVNKNIDWDEVIDHVHRKQKEDNVVKRYQALKRKPQTEAQARKNMMIYLRNVAGFKMDYFKGMTYDDIRPIFEKKFNSNVAFLLKIKEQMDDEDSRALKRLSES
nr:putative ribonuclease H-like domain-containing protein [Tanacetum cinerariifolium]